MSTAGPVPAGTETPIARTLYEIAHALDTPRDREQRLGRALRLLQLLVPYDHCALLEATRHGDPTLVMPPGSAGDPAALRTILTRFLRLLAGGDTPDPRWLPADLAHLAAPSHLAVPVIGLDQVLGVLLVMRSPADAYREDHLGLLSVVASQLAAYLSAYRLKQDEDELSQRREAARVEAEAANRAKDEFLAILAHELRNPLAPILAAMQTIRRQADADPAVRRARDVVERQVRHLARLLDDLLDVSRFARERIHLRTQRVTLGTIVADAVETTRGLIDERGHTLSLSLPESPIWLEGDPTRLVQVVGNLLNNAAKYTPPGGRVSVTGAQQGDQILLRVSDNGIGIAAEMLPRVFEPFTQGHHSLDRSSGGLGVGLTLARTLVELHGGTLTAASEGPGRGSEFVVRLPVGPGPDRDATARDETVRPAVPRHILVIEDNEDLREMLRTALEIDGHRVEVAQNGMDGLEVAMATTPDVALVDVGLPGLDGYEVARRLRAAFGSRLFLIALTGYGQAADRRRAQEAGFDAHLVKPVSHDDLSRLLATGSRRAAP
jgi:signal transduction histidine kinase/ActR/RegA family two-component response regulator